MRRLARVPSPQMRLRLCDSHGYVRGRQYATQIGLAHHYTPHFGSSARMAAQVVASAGASLNQHQGNVSLARRIDRSVRRHLVDGIRHRGWELDARNLEAAQVFHTPGLRMSARVLKQRKLAPVLTVHDIIAYRAPQYYPYRMAALIENLVLDLRDRGVIIAVSQATKNDLCEAFNFPPERIHVVHLAADREVFRPMPDSPERRAILSRVGIEPGEPYLLSLATNEKRKNPGLLLDAVEKLAASGEAPDLKIVLVGNPGWGSAELGRRIAVSPVLSQRVIVAGFVADEDLAAIYSGAFAFVYPSFYEGFGLPIVEAMQCGVPVIAANNSSLPEVCGGAGRLIDARSVDDLCAAILSLQRSTAERARHCQASLAQAERFSWENCVRETIRAYELARAGN